jgi:hypothetical protein
MAQAGLEVRAMKYISGLNSMHSFYVLRSTSDLGKWYDPVMMPTFDAFAWLYWYLLRPDLWTHYRIFPSDRHIGRLLTACYISMYRAAEYGYFDLRIRTDSGRLRMVQKQIREIYCRRLKTPLQRSRWYNACKVWLHNLPDLSDFPDFEAEGRAPLPFPDPRLFYSPRNFQRFQNLTPLPFRYEGEIDSAVSFILNNWTRYDLRLVDWLGFDDDDDDDGDEEQQWELRKEELQRLADTHCESPQKLLRAFFPQQPDFHTDAEDPEALLRHFKQVIRVIHPNGLRYARLSDEREREEMMEKTKHISKIYQRLKDKLKQRRATQTAQASVDRTNAHHRESQNDDADVTSDSEQKEPAPAVDSDSEKNGHVQNAAPNNPEMERSFGLYAWLYWQQSRGGGHSNNQ